MITSVDFDLLLLLVTYHCIWRLSLFTSLIVFKACATLFSDYISLEGVVKSSLECSACNFCSFFQYLVFIIYLLFIYFLIDCAD